MRLFYRFSSMLTIALVGVFITVGLFSTVTLAATFDPLEAACERTPESAICKEKEATKGESFLSGENGVLMNVVNLFSLVVAVASVIIITVSGITMSLSSGDSAKVQSSRDAIIYSVVGLAVVALSRAIVIFVINRV